MQYQPSIVPFIQFNSDREMAEEGGEGEGEDEEDPLPAKYVFSYVVNKAICKGTPYSTQQAPSCPPSCSIWVAFYKLTCDTHGVFQYTFPL